MKYAFIVLIAIYLITYGCSSDQSKTDTKNPKKIEKINVQNSDAPATPASGQEQSAQPAAAQLPANQQETAQVALATTPAPERQAPQQPEPSAAAGEQPQAAPEQGNQLPQMEAQDDLGENQVAMPCGRVVTSQEMPCDMPCMGMMQQEGVAPQEGPQMQQMMPEQGQPQFTPGSRQKELDAAMQRMVQATNDMIMVTRQMVIATEEMLQATKEATDGQTDPGKDMDTEPQPKFDQPAETTEPAAQPQAQDVPPIRTIGKGGVESM